MTRSTSTRVNWPKIEHFHNLPPTLAGAEMSAVVCHFLTLTSSLALKEAWILPQIKMVLKTLACHLLGLLAFQVKSLFFVPAPSDLLACHAVSRMSLDLVTFPPWFLIIPSPGWSSLNYLMIFTLCLHLCCGMNNGITYWDWIQSEWF